MESRQPPPGDRQRRAPAARCLAAVLLTVLAILAGCASGQTGAVEDVAGRFEQVLESDQAEACELLAPDTREELESTSESDCASALEDAEVPSGGDTVRVTVAGHSAQVHLEHDTLFLALFDDGWRITAAGCLSQSRDSVPYDCLVKGG